MSRHRSSPGPARRAGFTLVELLVAIGILAIVAAISWRALSSLVATRDRLGPEADEVRALLVALGQIDRDLAQAPANPALLALAAPAVRVLVVDGRQTLEILRLAPPAPERGTAVQTVFYSVQDGRLLRQTGAPQSSVASAGAGPLDSVPLLEGVERMQVRFWQQGAGWSVPVDAATTPAGVEVVLQRADGRSYRRVMLVG